MRGKCNQRSAAWRTGHTGVRSGGALLPTPNDAVRDPVSGLLQVPVADKATRPAQYEFDRWLNTLDGFPTSGSAQVIFTGQLDATSQEAATLAEQIIVLTVDKQAGGAVARVPATELTFSHAVKTLTRAGTSVEYSVVNISRQGGWQRGKTHAVYVLDGLKDSAGKALLRSPYFELVAGSEPICEMKDGACVFNYSSFLVSAVAGRMRAANTAACAQGSEACLEEQALELKIHDEVLVAATGFEKLRQGTASLFALGELLPAVKDQLAKAVVAWGFTTLGLTEVEFDPTTGKLPGPGNDIIIARSDSADCKTGLVCIPAPAGESDADKALRLGLNTLDGFSTTAPYWATVAGSVDAKTLQAEGSFVVINISSPLDPPDVTFSYSAENNAIVMTPNKPLREKSQYAVVLVSASDGEVAKTVTSAGGLADKQGRRLVPSSIFALARLSVPLVDKLDNEGRPTADSKSRVSVLDDATASALEGLRSSYAELFNTLETNPLFKIPRRNIVGAWTFTTQSIGKPLSQLRALPWQVFGDAASPLKDGDSPALIGAQKETSAPSWWTAGAFASSNIGTWVSGAFRSYNALDPATGALFPATTIGSAGVATEIPFIATVPKGTPKDPAGWPLVIYQHGLFGAKRHMASLADALAAAGFATIAFDAIYHGQRSLCDLDAHCADSGATCDVKTGKCSAGALKDTNGDGVPDASGGARFMNTAYPFAVRDNLRQHVVDAAALLRAIEKGAFTRFDANLKISPTDFHYVGQSLGSILGTLVMAVEELPRRAVLNVPGAPIVSIFAESPGLGSTLDDVRKARGITAGSLADMQLLHTFQWILDAADPANFANYVQNEQLDNLIKQNKVPKKEAMVQIAAKDTVIPANLGLQFAEWLGAPTANTTYANQDHNFLRGASPDANATLAAQEQMITFLTTGQVCKPDLAAGTCN